MKKAITIQDIADQLQLSRNTVSKALNGQYVPEKTRELVLQKAREMNYKSMTPIDTVPTKKLYRILLVSGKPLSNFGFFIPVVGGIENYCFQMGYELLQFTYNSMHATFHSLSSYVKQLQPDGIIAIECFEPYFIEKLLSLGVPTVFYDFSVANIKTEQPYDIVMTNAQKDIYHLVKKIRLETGFTEFCFVGDPLHCLSFQERYTGMQLATLDLPRKKEETYDITRSDDSFDYGSETAIMTELLKLRKQPQCFICCNDFVARNVCNTLHLLNISVPEKAMVIGYDNVAESTVLSPTITTFSLDRNMFVTSIIQTLLQRIENPNLSTRSILWGTNLIERESTKHSNFEKD